MAQHRYYLHRNAKRTRVADMKRQPNPAYEIEQHQMDEIHEDLLDVYRAAAAGIAQYARHLDARMGLNWPPLTTEELAMVGNFLARLGGELLQTPGAQAFMQALPYAVDLSAGALGELGGPVEAQGGTWKTATAKAVGNYLREIRNTNEPQIVAALRHADALPDGAEELDNDEIDVTTALGWWLGDALKAAGPGVMRAL